MKYAGIIGITAGCALLAGSAFQVHAEVRASAERLKTGAVLQEKPAVAIANHAEASYCTPKFKEVLAKVIHACGLDGGDSRRGCQPADVKTLASINDDDFNNLFIPLKDRGGVVMFDDGSEKVDDEGKQMLEELWLDRKGARYFFILARASKTGAPDFNRSLSHKRANSALFHIGDKFKEPDLDKQVGLLWLGNEFAQLGQDYCKWNVSRKNKACTAEAINRSAFVSWVDCQL
jgi:outer membrane protein OmpA-like peptidoglycan-associated protein